MIQLINNIWIGDSGDGNNLDELSGRALLNVAQDLCLVGVWPEIEYAQVGLIDGPGNPLCMYVAAVTTLAGLVKRRQTLVCCHTGERSLVVALMYLNTLIDKGWDNWVAQLQERIDIELPIPNIAHKNAFNKMNWRLLAQLIGD